MEGSKIENKVDDCITSICDKVMKDDFVPGEYADTVKALASLVEARTNYMQKKQD